MAYSKFEFFDSFGEGDGKIPDYGENPRTFGGDISYITRHAEFAVLRRVNARIKDSIHEVTIWVGIKENFKHLKDNELERDMVVDKVALTCPPYVQELVYIPQDELESRLVEFEAEQLETQ